ncbi:MAG: protein-glutamate O-methyltransferase CheR [Acidobacteria bacterium]|nr:protein-glutamate O-methyltransferase CheR [Acidobacteriota bacterium]
MACTDADYAYLRDLVLSQSANRIDASRKTLFDTKLTPVARLAGASSVKGLVDVLRSDRSAHLRKVVAQAMMINETSFFRDVKPFDLLRAEILPRLVASRREQRKLRIWSAASSTGQEAYSVAMLLATDMPEVLDWDIKIIGTDISQQVVDYARGGRYRRLEVNRGLPASMLLKYMTREGEEWQVSAKLRNLCDFRCANLCDTLSALPTFDLVLLRNVLLYFSQEDRGLVFRSVYRQMARDGYLLLGNAEQAEESTDRFRVEFMKNSYFYRPVNND